MRITAARRTFLALTAAGAALCVAATASAASWTPPQKIENRLPVS